MKYAESYTAELKSELNADFKKEIIAFANASGGEIFAGVNWDGVEVILVINSKEAKVNGISRSIDVADVIIDGATMIPVRFISEGFGFVVNIVNNNILITN